MPWSPSVTAARALVSRLAVGSSDMLRSRKPLCNGRAHTALTVGGIILPLCARCSGVVAGCLCAASTDALVGLPPISELLGAFLCLPCILDGVRSYRGQSGTTNGWRFGTGFLLGAALTCSLSPQ